MANHPNRSKRSRLNLLISSVCDDREFAGLSVYVRRGYSALSPHHDAELIAGREHMISVRCSTAYDPRARNNLGLLGASIVQVDTAAVEETVSRLLAQWGSVPVQDNSGRFAHLATTSGVITI